MMAHMLADVWGVLPSEILERMSAFDLHQARVYYSMKHDWELKQANQASANAREKPKRLI